MDIFEWLFEVRQSTQHPSTSSTKVKTFYTNKSHVGAITPRAHRIRRTTFVAIATALSIRWRTSTLCIIYVACLFMTTTQTLIAMWRLFSLVLSCHAQQCSTVWPVVRLSITCANVVTEYVVSKVTLLISIDDKSFLSKFKRTHYSTRTYC